MDEDNDIFEMIIETIETSDDEDGRMRVISKNPRYAADDPAAPKSKNKYVER